MTNQEIYWNTDLNNFGQRSHYLINDRGSAVRCIFTL